VINIGFFDRFQFGKKKVSEDRDPLIKDDTGLNGDIDFERAGLPSSDMIKPGYGMPEFEQTDFGVQQPSSIESFRQSKQTDTASKELELISSKLDTIKLILNDLDRRIANLEKIAKE